MSMDSEQYDFLFKIVMIGDSTVGKTALLQRFKNGSFNERHSCTIGVDFIVKTLDIASKVVKLHIWDTAGQERFKSVSHSFYHNAHAAIVVYDITNEGSFYTSKRWLEDVRKFASRKTLSMLIGNKLDCASTRTVSKETARHFSNDNNIAATMEVSAKENVGVDEMFTLLTRLLLDHYSMTGTTDNSLNNIPSSDSENEREDGEDVIHYRKRHVVPVSLNEIDDPKSKCNC